MNLLPTRFAPFLRTWHRNCSMLRKTPCGSRIQGWHTGVAQILKSQAPPRAFLLFSMLVLVYLYTSVYINTLGCLLRIEYPNHLLHFLFIYLWYVYDEGACPCHHMLGEVKGKLKGIGPQNLTRFMRPGGKCLYLAEKFHWL